MKPEHEARRKIIREWMSLPKDKRQTEEQVKPFAKKAMERIPSSGDPYGRILGGCCPALVSRDPSEEVVCSLAPFQRRSRPLTTSPVPARSAPDTYSHREGRRVKNEHSSAIAERMGRASAGSPICCAPEFETTAWLGS